MNPNNFEFLYIIGRGGFGKVWKVKSKKTNKYYALKQMSKVKIIDKKSIKSINSERELLSKLYHPFIVNMHYAFQDNKYLYLVMDLLTGGDLRYHISIHKKFSEEQTRFFICGITLSLGYIHNNNIIHRDIKPENLVLDANGYIRLTDFGIAKINTQDNSSETSGTPGYMSPEVIKSLNHSFPADFFALGVIGYEFLKGERPYIGKNRREIKEEIMSKQAEISTEEIKRENWSKESIDFINRLLMRKPEERLGFKKGIEELKDHPWLRYYPWSLIKNKKLPSPFVPQNRDNFDSKYCKGLEYIGEETKIRYEKILSDDNYEFYFRDFYYNIDEDKKRNNDLLLSSKIKNKIPNNKKKNNIIRSKNNSKDKNSNKSKINKIYNLFNKINTPNNKNNKYINLNINKYNDRNTKLKHDNSKESNLIMINFNINNITNNNINKNKVNNFFFNKNKTERVKKLIRKTNNYNKRKKNKSNIVVSLNDNSLNQINSLSRLNSSNKLKLKNNTNISKSKSKTKSKSKSNNKDLNNKYCYNNSLIKKLTKANLSQVRLLKNRNKNNHTNNNNNIGIGKCINKTNSQIYSISYTNRDNNSKLKEKNNLSINTISLNDGLNKNNSKKINIIYKNNNKENKQKIKKKSIKNISSIQNLKLKKVIINKNKNKKVISNNNNNNNNNNIIHSKRNIKYLKNIPLAHQKFNYESFLKKNKTLQNKGEITKKILNVFNKNKNISYKNQRYLSNYDKNNIKKNNIINTIIFEKNKFKFKGTNSENNKKHKRFFSDLE